MNKKFVSYLTFVFKEPLIQRGDQPPPPDIDIDLDNGDIHPLMDVIKYRPYGILYNKGG